MAPDHPSSHTHRSCSHLPWAPQSLAQTAVGVDAVVVVVGKGNRVQKREEGKKQEGEIVNRMEALFSFSGGKMANQAVIEGIETRTVLVAVAAGRARQEELVYRRLVYGVRDVFLGLGSLSLSSSPFSPPLPAQHHRCRRLPLFSSCFSFLAWVDDLVARLLVEVLFYSRPITCGEGGKRKERDGEM